MADTITAKHAADSGHWYEPDGKPAYTIIGKNGNERPTTLRDARKLGLVPSVTTIIYQAASPGLQRWKDEQLLMACLTTDRLPDETESEYIDRIIKDSKEQSEKAKERGTYIHAVVQSGFEDKPLTKDDYPYYASAKATLDKLCGAIDWQCEQSFAVERYGGKKDLEGGGYLIDIKTTTKDLTDIKTWPEHAMQLSAYDYDKKNMCGILYINTDTAESKLIFIDEKELNKGWKMFAALLDYFYAKSGLGEAK
jgi:hypothetical protein